LTGVASKFPLNLYPSAKSYVPDLKKIGSGRELLWLLGLVHTRGGGGHFYLFAWKNSHVRTEKLAALYFMSRFVCISGKMLPLDQTIIINLGAQNSALTRRRMECARGHILHPPQITNLIFMIPSLSFLEPPALVNIGSRYTQTRVCLSAIFVVFPAGKYCHSVVYLVGGERQKRKSAFRYIFIGTPPFHKYIRLFLIV